MYSPELMKFLLNYKNEEQKSSKKIYNLKNGNKIFGANKYATIPITVRNK